MSADRFAVASAVADAVLYEGYVLYPYRASARKNQVRWQFGVLVPRGQLAHEPSERSAARTESVIDPGDAPRLHIRVRCLQVQHRALEQNAGTGEWFAPVDELVVGDAIWVPWDEAVEHEIDVPPISVFPLGEPMSFPFVLPGGRDIEDLSDESGTVGRAVRDRAPVSGIVHVDDGLGPRARRTCRAGCHRREHDELVAPRGYEGRDGAPLARGGAHADRGRGRHVPFPARSTGGRGRGARRRATTRAPGRS